MNKSQLVSKVAEKSGLTKKDTNKVIDSLLESIEEALVSGEKVVLVGFGTFEVKERKARSGRNPRTGEVIKVSAKNIPTFKAGKAIKDKVNK